MQKEKAHGWFWCSNIICVISTNTFVDYVSGTLIFKYDTLQRISIQNSNVLNYIKKFFVYFIVSR